MKSITEKAKVSLDFPDKAYMARLAFDVTVELEEVLIRIVGGGEPAT